MSISTTRLDSERVITETIRVHWVLFLVHGIIMMVLGVLAVIDVRRRELPKRLSE